MSDIARPLADPLTERWREAWAGGGFEVCCTPDVAYEDPVATEPLHGVEELDRHAIAVRAAFPDLRIETPAPTLVRDDHACIPWKAFGTHRGDTSVLPATDRFVVLHGVHYIELSDGVVRRARGFFDLYDAATQLGLLPERGGLGESALLMLRGFGLRRKPGP